MSEEKKREEREISRREFIKDAGLVAGSAAIGSMAAMAAVPTETAAAQAAPVTFQVYDPTGTTEVTQLFAKRLGDLTGKTICEVSNDGWEAQRTFPYIRELLQRMYPTAKFVPYDQVVATRPQSEDLKYVIQQVKAAKCDAVIAGNAG